MEFLREIMERPVNERAYMLLAVGYPDPDARVPVIRRKEFEEFVTLL